MYNSPSKSRTQTPRHTWFRMHGRAEAAYYELDVEISVYDPQLGRMSYEELYSLQAKHMVDLLRSLWNNPEGLAILSHMEQMTQTNETLRRVLTRSIADGNTDRDRLFALKVEVRRAVYTPIHTFLLVADRVVRKSKVVNEPELDQLIQNFRIAVANTVEFFSNNEVDPQTIRRYWVAYARSMVMVAKTIRDPNVERENVFSSFYNCLSAGQNLGRILDHSFRFYSSPYE